MSVHRAVRVTSAGVEGGLDVTAIRLDEVELRVASRAARGAADVLVSVPSGTPRRAQIGADTQAGPGRRRTIEVVVDGWRFELEVEDERRAALREHARSDRTDDIAGGTQEIRAIIPGRVIAVGVAAGDQVAQGDRLFVLEAMKMQNELRAPRAGRVARVAVAEGQTVEARDLLLVLE